MNSKSDADLANLDRVDRQSTMLWNDKLMQWGQAAIVRYRNLSSLNDILVTLGPNNAIFPVAILTFITACSLTKMLVHRYYGIRKDEEEARQVPGIDLARIENLIIRQASAERLALGLVAPNSCGHRSVPYEEVCDLLLESRKVRMRYLKALESYMKEE